MNMNIVLSSVVAIMFCLIKIGICWEDVKFLLLKCHCDVVSLKWNYDGVLYFVSI